MSLSRWLTTLVGIVLLVFPAAGADLSRIERKIVREPAYRSKPRYCLLVLGPEAKTRVWLVQDGDILYVDRNGNGDLTEPGEKVVAEKREECDDDRTYTFEAGELREGGRRHLNLSVRVGDLSRLQYRLPEAKSLLDRDPRARRYSVGLDVEKPGYQGLGPGGRLDQRAGLDGKGLLQFTDRPQDAPIIHFGGPWTLGLHQHTTFCLDRSNLLALIFGTPGQGAGTFAYLDYRSVVPEDLAPRVEIAFPPRKPGGPPVLVRCELKERC